MTTRARESDPWETPVNLGPTVNSPGDDTTPDISADGLTLFFCSTRPGGFGNQDLWHVAVLSCPADLNCDGALDILDVVAFQILWTEGDPGADCDGNGAFSVLDFVCFQQLFVEGCE
jgi:hypothetical protein